MRRRWREDAWQRAVSFGVLLLPIAASLLVSFLITPDAIENGSIILSPPCTFKTLFGIPCFSCGMTRAFAAMSHGQLALAWSYNKFAPAAYVAFWVLAIYGSLGLWRAARDLNRLGRSR